MRREYLMLAQTFTPDKHFIGAWYASIKLDGMRCFWDGGVSIGKPKFDVPWANLYRDTTKKREAVCTGLWSRYGNIIHAPKSFIDKLPLGILLDGELWCGRGQFQEGQSIVTQDVPDARWAKVKFKVFDLPAKRVFCQAGEVDNPNCKVYFSETACRDFMSTVTDEPVRKFSETLHRMDRLRHLTNDQFSFLSQTQLPYVAESAAKTIDVMCKSELEKKGEGLVLRSPASMWVPSRIKTLLKVKPFDEDEGTVVGYIMGKDDHLGRLGSLLIEWSGKRFAISGFTHAERSLDNASAVKWAMSHPGEVWTEQLSITKFKYGDRVKFRYRTFTDEGIPREARYSR